nr:BrnT family toxin [Nodularia spumigena]
MPARTEDEPRFLIVGVIAQKYWSAIITYRENRVRIVSIRRSRKEEVAIYESNRI